MVTFLGHERSEIAHMVTFLRRRAKRGALLFAFSFWGTSGARLPIWWRFFFADFVTCANFSNLCGKFLKTHNRYGHHVSAKSCARSWATFSSKKNFEKNSASWFFLKRSFEKTLFSTIFYVWTPISQNQDQIQGPWFRVIYKRFIGYIFAQNWRQNFFSDFVFWAKNGWKKMSKIFFSFVAHISQNWRKIQKPFSLKINSKDVS